MVSKQKLKRLLANLDGYSDEEIAVIVSDALANDLKSKPKSARTHSKQYYDNIPRTPTRLVRYLGLVLTPLGWVIPGAGLVISLVLNTLDKLLQSGRAAAILLIVYHFIDNMLSSLISTTNGMVPGFVSSYTSFFTIDARNYLRKMYSMFVDVNNPKTIVGLFVLWYFMTGDLYLSFGHAALVNYEQEYNSVVRPTIEHTWNATLHILGVAARK